MGRYIWRIICSLLAFLITHSVLAMIMGYILGAHLDQHSPLGSGNRHFKNKTQEIFFNTSFQILGYLAKSDGHVSRNEINAAENVMQQMGLNKTLRDMAITLFDEGKQPDFNPKKALQHLKLACRIQPQILNMFIEIQLQMAYADSRFMSSAKERAFLNICNILGVSGADFNHFRSEQRQQYHYTQAKPYSLQDDYTLLNIHKDASDADVKQAYRKAMSKNHPDKLIAQGVPPEMVKIATQKTQEIKAAFERIKANRI